MSRWICLFSVIIAAVYFVGTPNFRWQAQRDAPYGGDFLQEWLGGYLVRTGQFDRFEDTEFVFTLQHDRKLLGYEWNSGLHYPLVYPPFYYVLVSPLSWLNQAVAAVIWWLLMVVAFIAAQITISRHQAWGIGQPGNACDSPWALLFILFPPVAESLMMNQKGTLCLLIFTGSYYLLSSGARYRAGVVFGLLMFKPQLALALLAIMLFKRQWRFVVGALTTAAAFLAISLPLGWQNLMAYGRFLARAGQYADQAGYNLVGSHSWLGFFRMLRLSPAIANLTAVMLCVGILACLVYLWRGPLDFRTPRFAIQFSGAVVATVLVSPHVYAYDLTILTLPLVISLQASWGKRSARGKLLFALALAIFVGIPVSEMIATAIGFQLSVPLMAVWLIYLTRHRATVEELLAQKNEIPDPA